MAQAHAFGNHPLPSSELGDGPRSISMLRISQPDDREEVEADRVAEAVTRNRSPGVGDGQKDGLAGIQRFCAACAGGSATCPACGEGDARVRFEETGSPGAQARVSSSLQDRIAALQGSGQPLSQSERDFFEPRFGFDFSQVRIHKDGSANEVTRAVSAKAFTIGEDIVFGAQQYRSGSPEGKRLLAHELTHAVQQRSNGRGASGLQREVSTETPSWLQRLNDRGLIRNVGSANYYRWIETLQNVLTESDLGQVVDQVCSDPYARVVIQTQGLRGLVALHDANGDVASAQRRLRQWRYYTREMLRDRSIVEETHEDYSDEVQSLLERSERGAWRRIVTLFMQSPENHEPVVLALLRALQSVLQHRTGPPSGARGSQDSTCTRTTRLIVHGLRAIGIPAHLRTSDEFVPELYAHRRSTGELVRGYTHSFPWFPSLQRGFTHGDDLYNRPLRDPAELLVDEAAIVQHWRSLWEAEMVSRGENARLLPEAIGRPSTAQQEVARSQFIARNGAHLATLIEIPSSRESHTFQVSVGDVLTVAPAQLVLSLANLREGEGYIASDFDVVQAELRRLPRMVELGLNFG